MTDPRRELDELRRALAASGGQPSSDEERRLRRLAQAVAGIEEHDDAICRHCRQMLPQLAEAELRGERIARLFPAVTAHLDLCEQCGLEYADLLDALLELEEVQTAPDVPPPALPQRFTLALRLRGWVLRAVRPMVSTLEEVDPASFEAAARTVLERLASMTEPLSPRQAQGLAMAWGGGDESIELLLAWWDATERLVQRYSLEELAALAASGQLADVAQRGASETARRLRLSRQLRARFVEHYVAAVREDPHAFVALARTDG